MRKIYLGLITLCTLVGMTACNTNAPSSGSDDSTSVDTNTGDDDGDFVEKQTWSSTISIVWNGGTAVVSGEAEGVTITNESGVVSLSSTAKHVEYAVSGSGTGQLNIYSDYKFKLSMSGLTLACTNGPAINNQCGKTCYVVLSGSNTLSDGERQRVMIAKALAQDTPFILLDEPTAHLDVQNRIDVMSLLKKLTVTANKAILLSTHELHLALNVSDFVWIMKKGQALLNGTPRQMMENGEIAKAFNLSETQIAESFRF